MVKSRGDHRGCVFSKKSIWFLAVEVKEIIYSSIILSSFCKLDEVRMWQSGKLIHGCLKAIAQHYKNFKILADFFFLFYLNALSLVTSMLLLLVDIIFASYGRTLKIWSNSQTCLIVLINMQKLNHQPAIEKEKWSHQE